MPASAATSCSSRHGYPVVQSPSGVRHLTLRVCVCVKNLPILWVKSDLYYGTHWNSMGQKSHSMAHFAHSMGHFCSFYPYYGSFSLIFTPSMGKMSHSRGKMTHTMPVFDPY